MRALIATLIAAVGLVAALTAAAVASQPAPSTIEKCAALLPQGKTFTFELAGVVDTTGSAPKLTGEMSVSDGTQADRTAEGAAFGKCIARLIR